MAATVQTAPEMGRPKSEKPKNAAISLRTYAELKSAIDEYAREEHRTTAQMTELLLREAVIARRKRDKKATKDIDDLP